MAEALYRKYRPQVFEDVVGQEPIERTLKNAISQDKVSHAYLFCGPRGTGKTTTARLLAKALLCVRGPTPDPDGSCEDCNLIAEGVHPDVYELDAASRTGVDNVREEIISRVHFAPTRGRYKVYIIDEVHMLSTAAFNALLKTLEEPPSHVVFVLCTTDPQKVPETIHSRCQRFDFHRISPESMVARLGAICMSESVEFEGEALDLIAQRADGGLRNALTSLEQIIAFENGKVTFAGAERLLGSIDSNDLAEIMAYIGKRDIANCFRWTAAFAETGADLAQFVRDMSEHVRNLYIMALAGDDAQLEVGETTRRELAGELSWFGPDRAARLLGVLGDLMAELKTTSNQRLAFEIALTRMVRPDSDLTLESLAERVEALESGYSAVAHVLPGEPFATHAAPSGEAAGASVAGAEPGGGVGASSRGETAATSVPRDGESASRVFDERQSGQSGGYSAADAASAPAAQASNAAVGESAVTADQMPVRGRSPEVGAWADASGAVRSNDGVAAAPNAADAGVAAGASPGLAAGGFEEQRSAAKAPAQGSRAATLANPAALQRIWQAVLADIKKRKQAYGVLFMSTKAVFDEAKGMVRVVFPSESTFAFNAVQKPDVRKALEEALAKAVGEPVDFCLEKGAGEAIAPSSAAVPSVDAPRKAEELHGAMAGEATRAAAPATRQEGARETREARLEQPSVGNDGRSGQNGQLQDGVLESAPSYDAVPYDEVPYEQVPYDEVPYDDMAYDSHSYDVFGASYASAESSAPHQPNQEPTNAVPTVAGGTVAGQFGQSSGQSVGQSAPEREASASANPAGYNAGVADASTSPSPSAGLSPEGGIQEDPAALEAMLQASFGDGVVFSETQE